MAGNDHPARRGSSKTTLIARLLTRTGNAGTLVVVNEFGEVGIDHDLLEASSDDTILLANGCLCCTIRGILVDTLLDVQAKVAEGRLRAFDRVVVETSGVADPAMLLGFLLGEAAMMARYRLDGVVATIDALAGTAILARHPEAAMQVRVADRLLLTKTDLAAPDGIAAVTATLRALNPAAPLNATVRGDIEAAALPGIASAERGVAASCGDRTKRMTMAAMQIGSTPAYLPRRAPCRSEERCGAGGSVRAHCREPPAAAEGDPAAPGRRRRDPARGASGRASGRVRGRRARRRAAGAHHRWPRADGPRAGADRVRAGGDRRRVTPPPPRAARASRSPPPPA